MTKGSFASFLLHFHPRYIPEASARIRYTWCMGGLAALMFFVETFTGVLLVLHYMPSSGEAYGSIQSITYVVPYGFFIRNLHYWGGQLMVVFVFLHMVRVFITHSYMPPRAFNWIVGLVLLITTLLVDFSGYLLVWDDRSLWAWTIARNLAEKIPFLGSFVAAFLFGQAEVGSSVLVRIYAWHVIFLPGMMTALMTWHFWRIRGDGGISIPL